MSARIPLRHQIPIFDFHTEWRIMMRRVATISSQVIFHGQYLKNFISVLYMHEKYTRILDWVDFIQSAFSVEGFQFIVPIDYFLFAFNAFIFFFFDNDSNLLKSGNFIDSNIYNFRSKAMILIRKCNVILQHSNF